jgi:hypothetical protein
MGAMGWILAKLGQFDHWHKAAGSGWLLAPYYGSPKRNRAMLTGSDLLAKVSELQAQNATRTDIVLACGYIKPDGKASYVAFYEALLAAKYPNGLPNAEWEDVETELEFDDEAQEKQFQELCENYPQKAVEVYYENIGNFDEFEDAYQGEFDSESHFTEEMIAQMGENIPSWIVVDYQATWDSMLRFDYWEEDNYFFRNI